MGTSGHVRKPCPAPPGVMQPLCGLPQIAVVCSPAYGLLEGRDSSV